MTPLARVADAQQRGETCAWIDCPHRLDFDEARGAGVEVGRLLVSQPETAEHVTTVIGALARSGAVDLVIVDAPHWLGLDTEFIASLARRECRVVVV